MNNRDSENDRTTPFIRDGEGSPGTPPIDPYRSPGTPAVRPVDQAMFNTFKAAKKIKAPKWAAPLLIGMAIFHMALFLVMWAKSIWDVEQLDKPKSVADIGIAPPPPPPPPPPKGSVKPQDVKIEVKKRVVKDLVQVTKVEKQPVQQTVTNTCTDCPDTGDSNSNGDDNGRCNRLRARRRRILYA
jgi:hypothetical protein